LLMLLLQGHLVLGRSLLVIPSPLVSSNLA
jgi:hypothetical protein